VPNDTSELLVQTSYTQPAATLSLKCLCFQGVEYSYVTCTTSFDGEEGQAVFADVVGDTAFCVVSPPQQDNLFVDSSLVLQAGIGPERNAEEEHTFRIRFVQPPVVQALQLRYDDDSPWGLILASLNTARGLGKVRS
jgi:hypothetical protein